MKYPLVILLTFFVLISFSSPGQKTTTEQELFKPFSLLIINPDSAQIADTLFVWADSIEKKHIDRYYYSIKALEMLRNMGDEESKRETDQRIQQIKQREMEAYDFKYYHTVANSTLFELSTLFNTNYWEENYSSRQTILEGSIIDRSDLFTYDLKKLGKQYKVDYIVTFENIRTAKKDGIGTIKYTTTLFWTRSNKIILKKEVEGNALVDNFRFLQDIYSSVSNENKFHESEIHCDNYLECMFKSAVRFSTEELFEAISKNQKK